MARFIACLLITGRVAVFATAASAEPAVVTLYCSSDEAFARPILAEFTRQSGIEVRPLFDTEAGKTTGLVHRLLSERSRPRADVWWSGEIFGTIQLAEAGALSPRSAPGWSDLPETTRDPQGRWAAFGLRARVVAYDPRRFDVKRLPRRWADLPQAAEPGRVALANPLFGTTRGQVAVLAELWGEKPLDAWLERLATRGARLADGNAQAVLLVERGQVDLAATDSDDVLVAQARGAAIEMHIPELDAPDGRSFPGTLWIPNSVAVIAGGPNPAGAGRLADYLASAAVERALAQSESANVPIRPALRAELRSAELPAHRKRFFERAEESLRAAHAVDYAAAAARLRTTDEQVRRTLLR